MKTRHLSFVALALASAPAAAQTTAPYWNEGAVTAVHNDDANSLTPIFFNTYTGEGIVTGNPPGPAQ